MHAYILCLFIVDLTLFVSRLDIYIYIYMASESSALC